MRESYAHFLLSRGSLATFKLNADIMNLDRTTAPAITDAIEFEYALPPINTEELDNGLKLHWLNAGVQDVVQVDWVFPAGLWYEPAPSVAHATAGMLKCGTSRHTAAQIHESLEFYGAQLKASAGNDFATVTLYTLTRHLPVLLPMVYEILTDCTFPQEELDIYRRNVIQKLLVNLRQCEFVANQQIDALIYGREHPYGRYSRREKIEALQREDIVRFYKSNFSLSGVQMFMGGKVGKAEVAAVNEVFGKTRVDQSMPARQDFIEQPAAERFHRINNDPDGVQGAIRIGRRFPNRRHEDYTPMLVLNTLFGGYFGSRLMSNIREEKGYTYGIYSALYPELSGGTLMIQTETGRDVTEDAVKEIYKEMELLREQPADEEELLLVKNYLLGGLLGDLDGPFPILRRWRTLILNGFDEAYFNNNVQIYKTITPAKLQALAQKYFDSNAFYDVVVI